MHSLKSRNISLFCCCLLKLSIVISSGYDRKVNPSNSKLSKNFQNLLNNQLMTNLGLDPGDMEKTEQFAQLSEKFPHFVPDFMRSLFEKHRFELFNLSLKIEGKSKHLGPIEMIHSHRLREIHTWPKVGIHKLIFKENSGFAVPVVRELRLNKKLFPRKSAKHLPGNSRQYTILTIFNSHFQLVKKSVIKDSFFSTDGWISIDISEMKDNSVFFLRFFRVQRLSRGNFKKVEFGSNPLPIKELYPYYANIVSFYKHQSRSVVDRERLDNNAGHQSTGNVRPRRDLSQYAAVDHSGDCQRHPLVVTFKEVGWSKWIIAPQSYNAYYCKGNCPYPLSDNFNATNHAIVQLLVHGLKDVSVPKPCCVPYQLTPETLLYWNNEGEALLREFKDMSVSSCSCR